MKEVIEKLTSGERNRYLSTALSGPRIVLKSVFDHPDTEVKEKLAYVRAEGVRQQENILRNEFENLKIP